MTREKEIKLTADKYCRDEYTRLGFVAGAEWADRSMITKVCEWLRNNWHKYINIDAEGVVCFGNWEKDFRKAMKGE